jgi:hypothetical protein
MPYFSSEQTDPLLQACHRQLERLSRQSQDLHYAAMADELDLPAAELAGLTRFCRAVNRRLYAYRRLLTGKGH